MFIYLRLKSDNNHDNTSSIQIVYTFLSQCPSGRYVTKLLRDGVDFVLGSFLSLIKYTLSYKKILYYKLKWKVLKEDMAE